MLVVRKDKLGPARSLSTACAINRYDFDAARFDVSQSNVTGAIGIFSNFLRDLFVARHFYASPARSHASHRQSLNSEYVPEEVLRV